jgi:lysophospholipase L1-like esterase
MRYLLLLSVIITLFTSAFSTGKNDILRGVKKVVFIGDSLTDGAAWPDWVMTTLRTERKYRKMQMFNAGVGGNTVNDIKLRLQRDVIDLQPDLVIMHAGTNDCRLDMDMAKYQQGYDEAVKMLRDKKIKVLLLTLPSVASAEYDKQMYKMDDAMRGVAKKYDCPVAEVHAAFTKAIAEGKVCIGPDGCHHLIDGWRAMGSAVLLALGINKPLIEKAAPYPGTVLDWYIGPAIPRDGNNIPEPELSVDFDPVKAGWRKYDAADEQKKAEWWQAPSFERGGIFVFGNPKRENNAGAFAFASVKSSRDRTTIMRVGGFKPYTVWLNGEKVLFGTTTLGIHPDIDRVMVKLKKGDNRIIVYNRELFYLSFD